MSDNKDDEKEYVQWFKDRGIKPFDIAINKSRLNIRISTDDIDSIQNAIMLEGTPDVDYIKVYLPFLTTEKVGMADDDDDEPDAEEKKSNEDDAKEAKSESQKKIEVDEEDEFEITEN
jgi:predicted DNA binding CopG/RHH family protein